MISISCPFLPFNAKLALFPLNVLKRQLTIFDRRRKIKTLPDGQSLTTMQNFMANLFSGGGGQSGQGDQADSGTPWWMKYVGKVGGIIAGGGKKRVHIPVEK